MVLIDTNIVLRYLLQDHQTLSPEATHIILNHKVLCLNAVVYEVIHVLKSVYQLERGKIADILLALFANDIIHSENKKVILKSLEIFQETSMDFIDCLLIAEHMIHHTNIQSFDKKLNNYIKRLSINS